MMKLSIASYSFHGLLRQGKMDIFGYLETIKYRYGAQADIWNGFFPTIEEDFILKVKDGLNERDLVLANLCVDGPHIWEDDADTREQHYKDGLAYLHVGEVLGARTIRIDAGVHRENFTEEEFDYIVKRYQEFAQRAYDNGYKIGPENHWGAERNPQHMKRLCEAVNHPGFGMLLHFHGTEGDGVMAPWAMHSHIMYAAVINCLEYCMNTLKKHNYQGFWSVEHHSGENEYTEVGIQVAHVRDILNKWRTNFAVPEGTPYTGKDY
jgi:sugar phosphate isomerase/epimerase